MPVPRLAWNVVLILAVVAGACAPAEDPVVVAWRARLVEESRIEDAELARLRADVARRVNGKTVRVNDNGVVRTLDDEQTAMLFEALVLPAGVFDEGVRREGGRTLRVLNAPARSDNQEIEASQRLLIDAETLLPVRYEFTYAFPGYAPDQRYDLLVDSR